MAKAKRRRKKLSGAAKRAFLARMAKGRRKRTTRSPSQAKVNVPKRRKTRGRRRARRNPPFSAALARGRSSRKLSASSVVDSLIRGAGDALAITSGQMATNVISRMVPVTATLPALGVRTVAALAAGIGAQMVLGADVGRMVLAGGLTVPINSAIRALKVPLLSGALASDEEISRYLRGTPGAMGAYPQRRLGAYPQGVGAYPQMGDGQGQQGLTSALMTGGNSYF